MTEVTQTRLDQLTRLGPMFESWIIPGIILGSAIVLGYLVEMIVMPYVRRMAARTTLKIDDIILDSTRGLARWWVILIGLMVAVGNSPLSAENQRTLQLAITFLWVTSATLAVSRVVGAVIDQRMRVVGLPQISLLGHVARGAVLCIGLLVAFNTIGLSIAPVLTALGVGGLAVALALQPTLSNLFSGIQILASKKIRPGDFVRLDGGDEGEVTDITWRDTTVVNPSGNTIIIPNARLAEVTVMNYALPELAMNTVVQVGVGYSSDLPKVLEVTRTAITEAMTELPNFVMEFAPIIRFDGFGDSAINLIIVVRVKSRGDQFMAKHHMVMAIHRHYAAAGIEIPFPMRTVVTRSA